MLQVLTAFKANEVEKGVKGLDKTDLDVLMKYLYRGFGEPTENSSAILLNWHDKVCFVRNVKCMDCNQV